MNRQVVRAINAIDNEEEPLLTDSSEEGVTHRLSYKARIALTCVYISQMLGSFAFTVTNSYLYYGCEQILHYQQREAVAITLVFSSVSKVSGIVSGILADVKLGCYQVAFIACCLHMIGQIISYVIFNLGDVNHGHLVLIRTFHMIGILLIAVGQGLWNVALLPLGMRHMSCESTDDQLRKIRQQTYLQWFCFFYALGTFSAILYLGTYGAIPTSIKLFATSMPLWATGVMTFLTIIGKRFYLSDNIHQGQQKIHRLIQAVVLMYRGSELDDNQILLIRLFGLKLVAFSLLSGYLAIYFQVDSTYIDQLRYLTNSTDNTTIQPTPSRNMALYHPIFTMATISAAVLYGRFAYTCLHWHRVCIGIFVASCSVACATGVQYYIADNRSIDYYWLVPQYSFIGVAQAFYFVGGFEMSYVLSIRGLETLSLGLFFGVGSLFGLLLYIGFVASGPWHGIFIPLFNTLWLLAIATLAMFMYIMIKCMETREKIQDDDPDITDEESDDRERSTQSWLNDSLDSISGRDRPVRIWENF